MNFKLLISTIFIIAIFSFSISSCTKTVTDTTTVNHYDTTTVITRDTLITRDTVFVSPKNPIVGLWIGSQTAGDGSSPYPLYYSYDIKANNTLLMTGQGGDGNTYYANGTWALNGTAFTAVITVDNLGQIGVKQNITAVYDSTAGTLTNGVVQEIGYPYSDTFFMNRVN
jgi:hypothetical protein